MDNDLPAVSPNGLRVAVIGLGRMGLRHIEAVQSLGMKVVAGADLSDEARAAAAQSFDLKADATYSDAFTLLDKVRPEGLVVATTAPSHAEIVIAAAEAGVKHILCEKPLASSIAQSDAMHAACSQSGTRLAVNHQQRFIPHYTRTKALLGTDQLGPLSSIVIAGSNFGLAMVASHYFEMFRYVTGQKVATINAWFEDRDLPNPRGPQYKDVSGRLLATAADGTTMFLDFSANAGWGAQVVFICRNGQVTLNEFANEINVVCRKPEFRDLPTTRYAMPVDATHITLDPKEVVTPTAAVWSAMLAGTDWPDGEIGAYTLRCLVAAHASHRAGGGTVAIEDPNLPAEEIFPWA